MTPKETERIMLLGNATREQLERIDAILAGRDIQQPAETERPKTIDRTLTRAQVAEILGCSTKTVTTYAKRGLIRPYRNGTQGVRARGYSAESVRALQEGGQA